MHRHRSSLPNCLGFKGFTRIYPQAELNLKLLITPPHTTTQGRCRQSTRHQPKMGDWDDPRAVYLADYFLKTVGSHGLALETPL